MQDAAIRALFILAGLALAGSGLLATPAFVARLVSPDGEITQVGYVYVLRAVAFVVGGLLTLAAVRGSVVLLYRVLLLAVGIAVPAVVLELALRLLGPRTTDVPAGAHVAWRVSPHRELVWENTPGYVLAKNAFHPGRNEGMLLFNSRGLRDVERTYYRSAQTIVVLGDSIESWDIMTSELYPQRLETMLNARPGPDRVQVLNLGVTGYGLHQKVVALKQRGLEWRPTHVVLGYCLNDPIPSSELLAYFTGRPRPLLALRSPAFLKDRARVLLRGLGGDYHAVLHQPASPAWEGVTADLGELSTLADQHGFRVIVVMFPLLYDTTEDYPWADIHRRVSETATAGGMTVIDLLDDYRREGFAVVRDDDVHPNGRGHAIAAERLYEAMTRTPGTARPSSERR